MLEVAYKIDHTDVLAKDIANAIGQEFNAPRFETKNDQIEASVEFYRLHENLSIQLSQFHQNRPVVVRRLGTDNDDLLILDFHLSGTAKLNVTDHRIDDTANGLTHGAYFANASVESYAEFPAGFYNQQFHIVLDKHWMASFFSEEIKSLLEKIEKATPFFMYERLNSSITVILLSIFKSNRQSSFRKSFLHGKTLQILSLFFDKIQNRGKHLQLGVSSYNDVSRLFELMIYVDKNLGEELKVSFLTKKIGFSESKLQNLCKAVYGKSLLKEITERRMIRALDLFAENGDSVSTVGYKLGYTNMSHFSKAFKKIHGFLPSEYLNR
ncbi:helix-turn-helix transcriptional regulator [Flavobacteriaceae bacterium TP-CH-4]|uniref:Helix-turn-helix transcriptional regulator n=1 Tax=Pelagihabitans pacificus TaxID=2696054 RepID=A0A967E6H1_9FLAO|nr:AraC family transcriptional regulator [Pelagihabitans pacificus]NHF59164.1 helix-turn-helix transcriptional regulator [Pelagihabitans pacificus]